MRSCSSAKDLSGWEGADHWSYAGGVATVHGGGRKNAQAFGDCQLHVEWATPEKVEGAGQGRGNSGVFLMEKYELQILDSYENQTYFDGRPAPLTSRIRRWSTSAASRANGRRMTSCFPHAVRRRGQARPAGLRHGVAKRRADSKSLPDRRRHRLAPPPTVPIRTSCRSASRITAIRCGSTNVWARETPTVCRQINRKEGRRPGEPQGTRPERSRRGRHREDGGG